VTRAPLGRSGWIGLVLWLVGVALCGWQIAHTRFSTDLSAFLPAAPDARQRVLIDQLKSGVAARTLLIGIDGGTREQRAAASRALAQRLNASGAFDQVLNGEHDALAAVGRWVFEHRYAISPAIDERRFRADGLREAIDDTLSLLGTPGGAAVKAILDRDPTGETMRIAEVAVGGGGPHSDDGIWVSRDGTRALLMVQSHADGSDLDAQARTLSVLRDAFAAAAPGLSLRMSGAPLFAVDSRAQIQSETRWLALAGSVVMGGLLLLAFASLGALAAAALPVATGVVAGIAAVSLVNGSVHGMTLGFGTTLIGEAVDYAIYYLIQAHGQAHSGDGVRAGWQHWLRSGWPTVRLGLLTSVCGFAALAFSGFPGLAQLGVFSIAGLIAAALTTRYVLTALLPQGARGVGFRHRLGRWAAAIVHHAPRARHLMSTLALAAIALIVWRHDRLWQTELSSLSPVSPQALALDAELRAELLAGDDRTLIAVRGGGDEAVLRAVEAVGARLDALAQQGRIAGYEAVTRWVPSAATQARRRAALPDSPTLQRELERATAGGSLSATRLQPFVQDVQRAREAPTVTPASLAGTAVAPLLAALWVPSGDGSTTALVPVFPATGASAESTQAAVREALRGIDGAQTLNIGDELRGLYQHYLGEAQTQALLGALAVVVLIALWLRSLPRLLAVCKPLAVAVLLVMGGFAALQAPLGILHLVGLLLVVAVGSNYALYLDMLHAQGSPDDDTLASLLLANLTTVLSFGLIAASGIPALSAIGRVVAPGALLALWLSAAYATPPQGASSTSH